MPAARSLDLVGPDLEAYMQQSFNRLILTIMRRLATKNAVLSIRVSLRLAGKLTRHQSRLMTN